jgi:hypothetical protein
MADPEISLCNLGRSPAEEDPALAHATRLVLQVCHIAGTAAFIEEAGLGPEGKDLRKAIRDRNTATLFDWLVAALSYQGISEEVAKNFMDRHGLASVAVIESALRTRPSCPKLRSYWRFHDCRCVRLFAYRGRITRGRQSPAFSSCDRAKLPDGDKVHEALSSHRG